MFFTNKSHSVLVTKHDWLVHDLKKLRCEDLTVINSQSFLNIPNQTHVSDQLYVKVNSVNRERENEKTVLYKFNFDFIVDL